MRQRFYKISEVAITSDKLPHPYSKVTIDRYVRAYGGQIGKLRKKTPSYLILKFIDGTDVRVPTILCIPVFSRTSSSDINTINVMCSTHEEHLNLHTSAGYS